MTRIEPVHKGCSLIPGDPCGWLISCPCISRIPLKSRHTIRHSCIHLILRDVIGADLVAVGDSSVACSVVWRVARIPNRSEGEGEGIASCAEGVERIRVCYCCRDEEGIGDGESGEVVAITCLLYTSDAADE